VLGGTIRASGPLAGIGSGGENGEVGLLMFRGMIALICNANGEKFAVSASSILLSDASLIFGTQANRLFGVSPTLEGWLNLTILYGCETTGWAEPLSGLNATFLQIGNLNFNAPLDLNGFTGLPWTFCVSKSGDEKWFLRQSTEMTEMKSAVVSLPLFGSYSIQAFLDGWTGVLETAEGSSSFNVSGDFLFIAQAGFVWYPPRTPKPTLTLTLTPLESASPAATTSPTAVFTVPLLLLFHSRRMILFDIGSFIFALED
jgi:hypothetical protein